MTNDQGITPRHRDWSELVARGAFKFLVRLLLHCLYVCLGVLVIVALLIYIYGFDVLRADQLQWAMIIMVGSTIGPLLGIAAEGLIRFLIRSRENE